MERYRAEEQTLRDGVVQAVAEEEVESPRRRKPRRASLTERLFRNFFLGVCFRPRLSELRFCAFDSDGIDAILVAG